MRRHGAVCAEAELDKKSKAQQRMESEKRFMVGNRKGAMFFGGAKEKGDGKASGEKGQDVGWRRPEEVKWRGGASIMEKLRSIEMILAKFSEFVMDAARNVASPGRWQEGRERMKNEVLVAAELMKLVHMSDRDGVRVGQKKTRASGQSWNGSIEGEGVICVRLRR